MNINEARNFMKEYFEKLYKKNCDIDPVLVKSPGLPEDMRADGTAPDEDGWCMWKLVPSTVTDDDIAKLEEKYGLKFPNTVKAFLTAYHHDFRSPIGQNRIDKPLQGFSNLFNPHLTANNYLPFASDEDGYYIICLDLNADKDGDLCPVVQFDHEVFFDLQYDHEDKGEEIPREKLEELAEDVSANFVEFLNDYFENITDPEAEREKLNNARDFMKNFFEKLYQKYEEEAPILLSLPDLPEDMRADGEEPDDEGWCKWKLVPSTVTDNDIDEYETEYEFKFPACMRAFLTVYHHCFENPIGRNTTEEPFEGLDNSYNELLAANHYLPFSWDKDGYYILCLDLYADKDGDKCPVVQFDHERLFDLQYEYEDNKEELPGERLEELAEKVSDNFYEFLNGILSEKA